MRDGGYVYVTVRYNTCTVSRRTGVPSALPPAAHGKRIIANNVGPVCRTTTSTADRSAANRARS